jgi:hypothetical protein
MQKRQSNSPHSTYALKELVAFFWQKNEMRKELIRIIATVPPLSLDLVEHGVPQTESDHS